MRRDIDELFGDVFERSTGLRGRGFSPSVDVYYVDSPPRAVVRTELAGVDIEDVALEIRGRQLLIAGERRPAKAEGRLYQQIEIEHGPFRRLVELGADVGRRGGARGVRGRHARDRGPARPPGGVHPARSDRGGREGGARMSIHIPSTNGETLEVPVGTTRLPDALPVLPLRDSVPFPETLIPLAIGQDALGRSSSTTCSAAAGCW